MCAQLRIADSFAIWVIPFNHLDQSRLSGSFLVTLCRYRGGRLIAIFAVNNGADFRSLVDVHSHKVLDPLMADPNEQNGSCMTG